MRDLIDGPSVVDRRREAAVEKSWPPPGIRTNGCDKGGQRRAMHGEGNLHGEGNGGYDSGYRRVVEGYVKE